MYVCSVLVFMRRLTDHWSRRCSRTLPVTTMVSFATLSMDLELSSLSSTTAKTTLWLIGLLLLVADRTDAFFLFPNGRQHLSPFSSFQREQSPSRCPVPIQVQVLVRVPCPTSSVQVQPAALVSPPCLRLYTSSSNTAQDDNNNSTSNSFSDLSLKQLIQILDERGIRYPATASRQDLEKLLLLVGRHQQQQQKERVPIEPNLNPTDAATLNAMEDHEYSVDIKEDTLSVAQQERAKRRRQRRRMLQNQLPSQNNNKRNSTRRTVRRSRILSDYYSGVIPNQLVQRAKRKARRLKRRLSDFWALDDETGVRDVRYQYVSPHVAASSNSGNIPSKQRKQPGEPTQPNVAQRVRTTTTTTSNTAPGDDKDVEDDNDVIDVAAQEVEVVRMSRVNDDSTIVSDDNDGGVDVFVARPIPTPQPNTHSRARQWRRPPPSLHRQQRQQRGQRHPTARAVSSASATPNGYFNHYDNRYSDRERVDADDQFSSFSRYPRNMPQPHSRPSRKANIHQQHPSTRNNNIYRLPSVVDGVRRPKSIKNNGSNNRPPPFPYSYRRPRTSDKNPYRRPPPQQKPKKVYSPYNSNNIYSRYFNDNKYFDDEEERDAFDRVGDFLADTADSFMWGRYDEDEAIFSQHRRPRPSSDKHSSTTRSSSPKRKFWKDRLEERLDSMLGIHQDGDFYHSWSDRFRQEHEDDNNVDEYDAFDVAQGRRPPSKRRRQQNRRRRQKKKPFWEDDDNLVSLLFGGRGGERKSIGSIWDDLYERQSLGGRSDFASGSVLLILRATLRSFFLVFGRVCGWASVQGALPQPVVVTGVAAAGLCAPAGRRLWAVAGTLLAMRATGELLHGYTLDDEDYDFYIDEDDDDKSNGGNRAYGVDPT